VRAVNREPVCVRIKGRDVELEAIGPTSSTAFEPPGELRLRPARCGRFVPQQPKCESRPGTSPHRDAAGDRVTDAVPCYLGVNLGLSCGDCRRCRHEEKDRDDADLDGVEPRHECSLRRTTCAAENPQCPDLIRTARRQSDLPGDPNVSTIGNRWQACEEAYSNEGSGSSMVHSPEWLSSRSARTRPTSLR